MVRPHIKMDLLYDLYDLLVDAPVDLVVAQVYVLHVLYWVLHVGEIEGQFVPRQSHLNQGGFGLAEEERSVSAELVVLQTDVSERDPAEGLGDGARQLVVDQVEVGVQYAFVEPAEEGRRDGPRELVVCKRDFVEVGEVAQRRREGSREVAVVEVEFLEGSELGEERRDGAGDVGAVDGDGLEVLQLGPIVRDRAVEVRLHVDVDARESGEVAEGRR
ncbi:polygalacturonase inhibitor-like [Iris pallida]|uniref:Polygalacturonase inhibitor-like n=1 Tax=Iris pallida TaxID=29817 RepID=A0AAX6GVN8_IRIPA|nr:polygalacturonase inhibitor-like [Iris pallida]